MNCATRWKYSPGGHCCASSVGISNNPQQMRSLSARYGWVPNDTFCHAITPGTNVRDRDAESITSRIQKLVMLSYRTDEHDFFQQSININVSNEDTTGIACTGSSTLLFFLNPILKRKRKSTNLPNLVHWVASPDRRIQNFLSSETDERLPVNITSLFHSHLWDERTGQVS